jgi:hypothetical protein
MADNSGAFIVRMFVASDEHRILQEYVIHLRKPVTLCDLAAIVRPHLGTEQVAHKLVSLGGRVIPLFYDELAAYKPRPFNEIGTEIVRHGPKQFQPRAKLDGLQVFGPAVFFEKIVWQ